MSRKQLDTFDPTKLKPGRSWSTDVVGPKGYWECHYFYRDKDGELFQCITKRHNTGEDERRAWQKLKKAKPTQLKQLALPVTEKRA